MNKNPISCLQEMMVSRKLVLPTYTDAISDKVGYSFKCFVRCAGDVEGVGYGTTKKAAKYESALDALRKLGADVGLFNPISGSNDDDTNIFVSTSGNYVGALNEMAVQMCKPAPTFEDNSDRLSLKITCKFLDIAATGSASSKKIAKQLAAQKVLTEIKAKESILENGNDISMSREDDKVEQYVKDINTLRETVNRLTAKSESNGESRSEISTSILKSLQTKFGDSIVIRVFQEDDLKHRYITMLRLEESLITVLGVGVTEHEAAEDLLQTISHMNKYH